MGFATMGSTFGNGMTSTVPMNFHGQDKQSKAYLGNNPNGNVDDEYISNLQQQIHFMELELKILKEKVVEDEKKSGIGSLFDDEKSSFQHISLLKQKYTKMRRDYDKKMEELNKLKLKVIGEQFVLDSQINIMITQNNKVKENISENDQFFKKRLFDIERDLKDQNNQRTNADNELRMYEAELKKEQDNNYNYKMTLIQGKANDELMVARHALEVEFQKKLVEEKEKVIQKFTDDRNDVKAKI